MLVLSGDFFHHRRISFNDDRFQGASKARAHVTPTPTRRLQGRRWDTLRDHDSGWGSQGLFHNLEKAPRAPFQVWGVLLWETPETWPAVSWVRSRLSSPQLLGRLRTLGANAEAWGAEADVSTLVALVHTLKDPSVPGAPPQQPRNCNESSYVSQGSPKGSPRGCPSGEQLRSFQTVHAPPGCFVTSADFHVPA